VENSVPDKLSLAAITREPYNANPYPVYQRLREADPVYWDEELNSWVQTRYSDIMAVLRDVRFSAERFPSDTSWIPEELQASLGPAIIAVTRQMLFLDPPDHTRLRGLVSKAFTPRRIEAMRPRIQAIVDELLDKVRGQRQMEVIEEFSYPLPAIVIAEMLGVPPEDREQFFKWTHDFGSLLDGSNMEMQEVIGALYGVSEFLNYFRRIIAQRRTERRDDLLQAMIDAEERGDRLSEQELLGNCVLLLAAGHGTTTHLIGNGLLTLLRHPEQMQDLREHPEIIGSAVEELLRCESPVQATSRKAKENVMIGGKSIMAGQDTILCLGAANRDPEQFAEPDRLDLRRQENRHLAFAYGIHFCLGAPLARVEAEIAFNTLMRRLRSPRLAIEEPVWASGLVFRGLAGLPIEFDGVD